MSHDVSMFQHGPYFEVPDDADDDIGEYEKPRWVPLADYDRLEAEVTALREAGDGLRACLQDALTAERSGGIRDAWYAHHERWDAALDAWRALEGPGDRGEG